MVAASLVPPKSHDKNETVADRVSRSPRAITISNRVSGDMRTAPLMHDFTKVEEYSTHTLSLMDSKKQVRGSEKKRRSPSPTGSVSKGKTKVASTKASNKKAKERGRAAATGIDTGVLEVCPSSSSSESTSLDEALPKLLTQVTHTRSHGPSTHSTALVHAEFGRK